MNDAIGMNNDSDRLETILDSIADGVFTVDVDWKITFFNRAAEKITGVPREEAVGERCCDVFRASICETDCALRHTMKTGKPVVDRTVFIINSTGERIPISISTSLLRNKEGQIEGGVESFRDLSLVEQLRKELEKSYTFEDIVSKSPKIRKIFDILPVVANSDSAVLITGDSGTGKELVARALHNLSPRRNKPMITVNCGALPDNLLESELFGYKAGAFTDAKKDKPGRFALADGGTIFLDEIGDVSPAVQVKLLRVLQDKSYEPLGAVETERVNVRILTATNRNLEELMAEGAFRRDLYYRINIIRLEMPPLRERMEDVPLLADHFVAKFNRMHGKDIRGLSAEALKILMNYDYPGNVRELENIIEHAFVLSDGERIIPDNLPETLQLKAETEGGKISDTMEEYEAQLILDTLKRNRWNRLAAAEELRMHKTTLYRKIRKLGIELPETDGRSTRGEKK